MRLELHYRLFGRFRRNRMRQFFALIAPQPTDRLVDIGGALYTWSLDTCGEGKFPVTLVNLDLPAESGDERFKYVAGSATALPFADGTFDIGFSNSVIEHVGGLEEQQAFAREARRVARKLWIQTPARSFPFEVHSKAFFIHFLPKGLQWRLVRNFTLWGWEVRPTSKESKALIEGTRLLTFREFQHMFPDCKILRERFWGLTKSYIAVRT